MGFPFVRAETPSNVHNVHDVHLGMFLVNVVNVVNVVWPVRLTKGSRRYLPKRAVDAVPMFVVHG